MEIGWRLMLGSVQKEDVTNPTSSGHRVQLNTVWIYTVGVYSVEVIYFYNYLYKYVLLMGNKRFTKCTFV